MAEEPTTTTQPVATAPLPVAPPVAPQLTQARVPLDEAGAALATPDASGSLPIVVLPLKTSRIRNGLLGTGLLMVAAGVLLDLTLIPRGSLLGLAAGLIVLGVFRSFIVPIPEGAQGILLQRGRYSRTLGPGTHFVQPWVAVSHVVTTRETPFEAPSQEIPTGDDVRTIVDILITFHITAPERFVFTISAPDFDQVCRATCQEVVRMVVRSKTSDEILDLGASDADRLRTLIGASLATYGVEVVRVVLTHVSPPIEFTASRESRRLAKVQRAEQEEHQALALHRQADAEALERQRIQSQRAAIELQADNEVARLERLEARIRDYPNAMHWDVEVQRLEVARALAANTRAMVQVAPAGDVAASLLRHTLSDNGDPPPVPLDARDVAAAKAVGASASRE